MSKVTLPIESNPGDPILSPSEVMSASNVKALYRATVMVTVVPKGQGSTIIGSALIDTGADVSGIDKFVAQLKGWVPIKRNVPIKTAGRIYRSAVYEASLSIADHGAMRLNVMSVNLRAQRLVAVVGTDILAHGRLVYDGQDSKFTLELP